jgi:hypothetical protein
MAGLTTSSETASRLITAICKQGVRGSSPLSSTSTRQNTPILTTDRGHVPLACLRQCSRRPVVTVRAMIGSLA